MTDRMFLLLYCVSLTQAYTYSYEPPAHTVVKRQTVTSVPSVSWQQWVGKTNMTDGIETQKEDNEWKDATQTIIDHDYYELIANPPNAYLFNYYWHELYNAPVLTHATEEHVLHNFTFESLLRSKTVEPEELKDSYRRAVNTNIKHPFPFYGVPTLNITIATGGFCYIGENSHSWLAATQYIAPLMANFDTSNSKATILYEQLKDRFIVQWESVVLRNQQEPKPNASFTFQASLWQNGSIWFVYKEIPFPVANISDVHHPRKVGLSDAYLENAHAAMGGKRIIHEYHRIEIGFGNVSTNATIIINPKQTCISYTSCESCQADTQVKWNCTWCTVPDSNIQFCSDSDGKHRMHELYQRNCAGQKDDDTCPAITTTPRPTSTRRPTTTTMNARGIDKTTKADDVQQEPAVEGGHGGTIFLVLASMLVLAFAGWLGYAYFNPMTTSGQCLIRYRPSRWRVPNSDVRYTASVHM